MAALMTLTLQWEEVDFENENTPYSYRALYKYTYPCWEGAVVEIDIRKYFNTIPHEELKGMLKKKISDERFLRLIDKLATAPTVHKGETTANEIGCPQGSILSPILANIYLHEVIDLWFESIKKTHFSGEMEEMSLVMQKSPFMVIENAPP